MKRAIYVLSALILLSKNLKAQVQPNDLTGEATKTLYSEITKAQEKKKDSTNFGWKRRAEINILFNQSNFSNWVQGGENSIALNGSARYFLSYADIKQTWDNRFWVAYGFSSLKSDPFEKKTQDIIEWNSIYGKNLAKNIFASLFLNFQTQIATGYTYASVNGASTRTPTTEFMSPGFLKIGAGALYKKTEAFKVNFAPATASLIFVNRKYTMGATRYYGVEPGKNLRVEFGANLEVYSKLNIIENVSVEQIASFYANYLQNFGNIDIFYRLNIVMKVNKFLSANFNFDAVYDDNAFPGFQTRQVLGVGLNYIY